mmetsp:Transcript_138550/g.254191  ORF Transcript_138550/g.254191 Transcript_138550/m.254191 type:complete len:352 (+) Transcript_138550:38-1093(+)
MDVSLEWGSLDSLEIDGDVLGQGSGSLSAALPGSGSSFDGPHVAANSQHSGIDSSPAAGAQVAGRPDESVSSELQDAVAQVQMDSEESRRDIWAAAPRWDSAIESPMPEIFAPPERPCASPVRHAAAPSQRWGSQGQHPTHERPRVRKREAEEDEECILQRCRREGPPGPAGALPALTCSWTAADAGQVPNSNARGGGPLSECVGWLCALKALDLPFDRFHLRGSGPCTKPSFMARQNLAEVSRQSWPRQRWHLVVVVRRVDLVAGEIDVVVGDPTGEMGATVDRRVPSTWPRAACEGTALLLAGVAAVRKTGGACRLLIMDKTVVRAFSAGDVRAEEAERLMASARAGHG